ncbi:hypothetical protein [Burkholderia sp. Leaf177]|uniref:hypothetical protein n=1 Tax=Burkholderia sp. Leaf177 TaxID=1736287 RepID=UPI000A93F522|nr:hypothetical protein [Burkholderia sp. Leaf177]
MTNQIDRNDVKPRISKIVRHAGVIYICGQTAKGAATSDIQQQTRATLAPTRFSSRRAATARKFYTH